jgi:hypothetical protein
MEVSAAFFLLMTAASSDGLLCIMPEAPFAVSFDNFAHDDVLEQLKRLPTGEDVPNDLCHVVIELNYAYQQLIVYFTDELVGTVLSLTLDEVKFDTGAEATREGSFSVMNTLSHACSEGKCEINFIEKHMS